MTQCPIVQSHLPAAVTLLGIGATCSRILNRKRHPVYSRRTKFQPDRTTKFQPENNPNGFLAHNDGSHPVTQNNQVQLGKQPQAGARRGGQERTWVTGPRRKGNAVGPETRRASPGLATMTCSHVQCHVSPTGLARKGPGPYYSNHTRGPSDTPPSSGYSPGGRPLLGHPHRPGSPPPTSSRYVRSALSTDSSSYT